MKLQINTLLLSLGIHRTLLGFHYLKYALWLCVNNEDYLLCFHTLCMKTAERYDTTADNVDHCMRTAIQKCWYNGNRDLLIDMAGFPISKYPTNSEFIDILYRHLELIQKRPGTSKL